MVLIAHLFKGSKYLEEKLDCLVRDQKQLTLASALSSPTTLLFIKQTIILVHYYDYINQQFDQKKQIMSKKETSIFNKR